MSANRYKWTQTIPMTNVKVRNLTNRKINIEARYYTTRATCIRARNLLPLILTA
jgi:hypothetical protein